MARHVSAGEVRRGLGELLDRVVDGNERFVVERRGKPMAALVSVAQLEVLERAARAGLSEILEGSSGDEELDDEEAMALGNEAKHASREG